MAKSYKSIDEESKAYSGCHTQSAQRVLTALLANGGLFLFNASNDLYDTLTGVFIKMGQHLASLLVLPVEWTNTMKVLQDKCEPTRYEDLEALFLKDMGTPIDDFFDSFDPKPVGVASLAQVHVGHHKTSGKLVAIKVSFSSQFKIITVNSGISCNILILQSSVISTWRWWM